MSASFHRIEAIFNAALDLPEADRAAYLDATCAGDTALRSQVAAMLADDASGTKGLLKTPVSAAMDRWQPARIGPYAITGTLGEGGMGQVFEARQESPSRAVALKVIRDHQWNAESDRRFAREAQTLAQLKHPGIAQIYASGRDADDVGIQRRYIAMELVRGTAPASHAAAHHLSTPQRLELLARICDAVQHAHQRGVIHRDLKPANILVEFIENDPIGQPKVLDFGVARLREDPGVERSMVTEPGRIIGTLSYMSPEQLEADPSLIDTRTDVFALGVIGYELLSGAPPLPLGEKSLTEAARIIRDVEPRPLGQIARDCRGDIETIIAKAMDKSRDRRYAGAADLAADLRRVLRNEPILARPPSTLYRASKFVRRNRALVAGSSIALLALVAGLVVSTIQYARATKSASRSQQVSRLLKDMIGGINPAVAQSRDTSLLKEIVDQTASRIGPVLKGQPDVAFELQNVLGQVYYSIGQNPEAKAQWTATLEAAEAAFGPDSDQVAGALIKLAAAHDTAAEDAKAMECAAKALAIREKLFGKESDQYADALSCRGQSQHRTNPGAAIADLKEALTIYERTSGSDSLNAATALEHLGQNQIEAGFGDEAEQSLKRCYAIREKLLGRDDLSTASIGGLIGDSLLAKQRFAEAEPYCRAYAEKMTKVLPPTQAAVPLAWSAVALAVHRQGRPGEAAAIYQSQEPALVKNLPPDDLNVGTFHNNIGSALGDAGLFDQAETEANEAIRIYRATGGPENLRLPFAFLTLANIRWALGDSAGAETLARQAFDMGSRTLPPTHALPSNAALRLAGCLTERAWTVSDHQNAAAINMLRESLTLAAGASERLGAALGPDHFAVWTAKCRIASARAALSAIGSPDAPAFDAVDTELTGLRDTLTSRPDLGVFPARDLLRIDVDRTLERLYASKASDPAIASKSAAVRRELDELTQALATRREAEIAVITKATTAK